ncbi:Non-SMC mitotic condensation complex subunit 1 [Giardia muris]|uniref:Non-SMC mitotic condensation complex subunit 1 n=1 Tax=Giardia muris TaxID=5742 RepID=A0A4Z1TCT3_GIAMU|nr:Non-SMC mitotic condensation complex subunit 1 [Giardia muris]|eukprot:TNJ30311.1 Non-SMC mitotic condensation complex subunit 1 [Giardia muris]
MTCLSSFLPCGPLVSIHGTELEYNGTKHQAEEFVTGVLSSLANSPTSFFRGDHEEFTALVLSLAMLSDEISASIFEALQPLFQLPDDPFSTALVRSHASRVFTALCTAASHFGGLSQNVLSIWDTASTLFTDKAIFLECIASLISISLMDICRGGSRVADRDARVDGGDLLAQVVGNADRTVGDLSKVSDLIATQVYDICMRAQTSTLSSNREQFIIDGLALLPITRFNDTLQALITQAYSLNIELSEVILSKLLLALERQESTYFNATTESLLLDLVTSESTKVRSGALTALSFSPYVQAEAALDRMHDACNYVRMAACDALASSALRMISEAAIVIEEGEDAGPEARRRSSSQQTRKRTEHEMYVKAARLLTGSLLDIASLVRKSACKGLITLLHHNPWGPSMNSNDLHIVYQLVCQKNDRRVSLTLQEPIDLFSSLTDFSSDAKELNVVKTALHFSRVYEEALAQIRTLLVSTQVSDVQCFTLIETCMEFRVRGSLESFCDVIAIAASIQASADAMESGALQCIMNVVGGGVPIFESKEPSSESTTDGVNRFVNRLLAIYQYISDEYGETASERQKQFDTALSRALAALPHEPSRNHSPFLLALVSTKQSEVCAAIVEKLFTGITSSDFIVASTSARILSVLAQAIPTFLFIDTQLLIRVTTLLVSALISANNMSLITCLADLLLHLLSRAFNGSVANPVLIPIQEVSPSLKDPFLHLLNTTQSFVHANPYVSHPTLVHILMLGGKVFIDRTAGQFLTTNEVKHIMGYLSLYADVSGFLYNENAQRMAASMSVTLSQQDHSTETIFSEFPEVFVAADMCLKICDELLRDVRHSINASQQTSDNIIQSAELFILLSCLGKFCATLPLNFKVSEPDTGTKKYFVEVCLLIFITVMKLPRDVSDRKQPIQLTAYRALVSCVITNASVFTTKFALEQIFYPLGLADWPEFRMICLTHIIQLISADFLRPDQQILRAMRLLGDDDSSLAVLATHLFVVINQKQPNPLKSHLAELFSALISELDTITFEEFETMQRFLVDTLVDPPLAVTLVRALIQLAEKYVRNETVLKRVLHVITYIHTRVMHKATHEHVEAFSAAVGKFMAWVGENPGTQHLTQAPSLQNIIGESYIGESRRTTNRLFDLSGLDE